MPSPLKVIQPDESIKGFEGSALKQRRVERTAYFERVWKEDPERFETDHTSIGHNRIERTKNMIENCHPKEGQTATDLGCGPGYYSIWLAKKGLQVDAVDIASLALERLKTLDLPNLRLKQDYVPYTQLSDDFYDYVICADLIGYLHPGEYRMLFSELARIVKPKGYVICSTPLELESDDALARFLQLAETEFEILNNSFAYDRFYIHVLDFLAWPRRIERASGNPHYRKESIEKRKGISRGLFKMFSTPYLSYLWKAVAALFNPISRIADKSDSLRQWCQKFTRFFWQDNGITHVISLAKRRSILNTDTHEVPHDVQEHRTKRTVWE